MKVDNRVRRPWLGVTLVSLTIFSLTILSPPRIASAASTGTHFDHIVIIAMENTPYASVFGSGTSSSCPSSSAPFLCSMLPYSSTIPSMNNYGATPADGNDFNGCSAACYVGLMFGYTYGVTDGYNFQCGNGSCSSNPQLVNSMASDGLTWHAYCAEGCPRANDHFPFPLSGNSNTFTSSSVTTSSLISSANNANPPNLLWFTPTDGENMHDVSVSTGDSYLQSLLVGSGNITSPASGSLLASKLFTDSTYHTLLYLWWDECGGNNGSCDSNNNAPNLFYGSTVKQGYVSPDTTGIDEYASLRTIESNWGLSPLAQGDTAAQNGNYTLNDIFTKSGNGPVTQGPTNNSSTGSGLSFYSILWLLAIGLILGTSVGVTIYLTKYHAQNKNLRGNLGQKKASEFSRSPETKRVAQPTSRKTKRILSDA